MLPASFPIYSEESLLNTKITIGARLHYVPDEAREAFYTDGVVRKQIQDEEEEFKKGQPTQAGHIPEHLRKYVKA